MKEAAGEANMTVVVILLIAIVSGVGALLIRNMMNSTSDKSCCTEAGGVWKGGTCVAGDNEYYDPSNYTACVDKNGKNTGTTNE